MTSVRSALFARLLAGSAIAALMSSASMAQDLAEFGIVTPDSDTPIVIIADQMSYDTTGKVARAEGNAEAYYGTRSIGADSLIYDADTGIVSAKGGVALSNDDGNYLFADEAVLGVDLQNGSITEPRVLIQGGGRLVAVSGERIDDRYNVLEKAVYSPCDVCEADQTPLWRIKADRIVHDEQARDIIYQDATFDVEGVSVFYLPYFRHPDPTVKRRTGFLTPEVSNDNTIGLTLKTPYFINLAPNRDLTLTPYMTTGDGLIMEAEYRARTETGQYRLEGFLTYNDVRGDEEFRGAIQGEGLFTLEDEMYWGYELNAATDDTFLRRYNYSDADRVTSRLFVGKETETLFTETNLLYFQSFRVGDSSETIPQALPEFRLHNRFLEDPQYGVASVKASAVRLQREAGRDYNRFSGDLAWERQFLTTQGLAITPFAEGQVDGYIIENDTNFDSTVQGRATIAGGVDVRMPFIAQNSLGVHVLEPIVQAIVAPDTDDPLDIPNEDSLDIEFDETNLFSTGSRFPGQDRFESGTRVNAGVRYDYQSDSGLEFEAVYGRVFRFDDNNDFSAASGLRNSESDHVGAVRLSLPPYFDIVHRMRLESGDLSVRRNEVYATMNYGRVDAELDYVFVEADPVAGFNEDREEIAGALGFKINENWRAYTSARHDFEESRFINVRGGLSYENECCALDFTVKRRFNDDRDADESTNFGLRVRLKTLGG